LIDTLLDICTIAYGDRVIWIYSKGYKDDIVEFEFIKGGTRFCRVRPYRELINVDYPNMLYNFINKTFPIYYKFEDTKKRSLMKFIESMRYSCHDLNFPAPFIYLGTAIENYVYESMNDFVSYYLNKPTRKSIFPSFKKWIEENIIPLLKDSDKDDFAGSSLKQKLAGLLQRYLRPRIISLLEKHNIDYSPDLVRNFAIKRNEAVHKKYKFVKGDYEIWSTMLAYMEELILKQLRYDGIYYDWKTSPPTPKNLISEK